MKQDQAPADGRTCMDAQQSTDPGGRSGGLRIGVLGPLAVWRGSQQAELSDQPERAILGLLATAAATGDSVHRETIIDAIWAHDPPADAAATVRSYVSALHRFLTQTPAQNTPATSATAELTSDEDTHRLHLTTRQLDLAGFAELTSRAQAAGVSGDHEAACQWYEQAVGLWRGEPLADVVLLRGHSVVAKLARRKVAVVLAYAEAAAAAGKPERVIPHLQALADRDRLDERAHARLMTTLASSGQQDAAMHVFDQLKARLDRELGVAPGAELLDIHTRIVRGAPGTPDPVPLPGAAALSGDTPSSRASDVPSPAPARSPAQAPPGFPAPRQLPPDARQFVGRAEELKELSELLDQAADSGRMAVISAIGGTAGVGKTALAIHWAHWAASHFPDGQLYVNLRGFDPSGPPVRPEDAVRGFLDALGIPAERIPVGLDARTGLLRSLLAGRRVLILLDNAQDAGQVRPLLPATSGCLALITSRNELTSLAATHSAQLISLDVLTSVEATELLERRLGRQRIAGEEAAVAQLARLCARLPLALTIISARAAVRRTLPLTSLVSELRNAHTVLDALSLDEPNPSAPGPSAPSLDEPSAADAPTSVRAVLSWSCRQLGDQAARLFRLLGAHPGPDISVPAAASLAGLPVSQAGRLLGELTSASLLTEYTSGRFTFHDLLRAYATEQARDHPAELHAARLRALDHYLQTGFAAALLLEPHRARIVPGSPQPGVRTESLASYQEALAWFDAEFQVALAAVSMAADHGYDVHAWQLAWTMADFLDWRGRWLDWSASQQIALEACIRLGDLVGQGHARRSLARACNEQGRYDETQAHLQEALNLYRQTGEVLGRARCHIDMAAVLERQSSYDTAIEHAEHALELFRAVGYAPGQANALNAIGWCHAMAGHHALALSYCQQAIDLQRELGDKLSEAGTWDSLGYARHHLGQYSDAISCYRRALEFCREVGHRRNQAEILDHLAETQQASGDAAAARESWRQALTLLNDLDHPDADRIRARLTAFVDDPPVDSQVSPAAD